MLPLDPFGLALRGRILIEASAGTGKTYTIGLLYLRLLLERELSIDQILVVTFTKAATEELRGRIRQKIREALDLLDHGRTGEEALQELMAGISDRDQARILLADALTRMDEAAIFTIHSFCQHMLQEHAFESGAPFEMEFLETEQLLRARIMEDFWRKRFYSSPVEEAAWAVDRWPTPDKLLAALGGHLSRPAVSCLPLIEDDEILGLLSTLEPLFAHLQILWQQQGEEIQAQLRDNGRLKRGKQDGYHQNRLDLIFCEMDGFLQAEAMSWLLSRDMEFFTRTKIENCLKVRGKEEPPDHRFFDLFDEFFHLHRQMTHCAEITVLLAGRDFLYQELERRKRERAQLYFDDLLTRLDKALGGPGGKRLAASIASRYPAILVDEFQDTDPLQYRIFSRIHEAGEASGLFLIGDPKQAIYGFRGADIFTYIQARRDTSPENRFTMTTNYRSTRAMVESVNSLFGRDNPFLFQDIGFSPVSAAGLADNNPLLFQDSPPPPLTCLLLQGEEEEKPVTKKAAEKRAAACCAHEIARLMAAGRNKEAVLDNRPLAAGDIGVLVRTHVEAETMRRALAAQAISSVYISPESVFTSPEAGEMLLLLTALVNLSDAPMVRRTLASELFGRTAAELDALHSDEALWEQVMAGLNDYLATWQQRGFLAMFQVLVSEQDLVTRLQAGDDGERRLTNYLHLAELLQQAAKEEAGPDGLLRWLNDQIHHPDNSGESMQLRLESDENLVKIVTIHKAKGLEYPVVFLPFLWSARTCRHDEPLSFHRPDEPETLYIDLGSGDPDNYDLAEQERLAGDLRLLYVALTRARYKTYFCWGSIRKMNESALCYLLHHGTVPEPKQRDQDLVRFMAQEQIRPFPAEFPAMDLEADDEKVVLRAKEFTGQIDTSWQITSYSRLTAGHDSHPERPDYDNQEESGQAPAGRDVFGFPRGPAAGTCLHAIFERINFTDPEQHAEIIHDQLERAGIDLSWVEVVETWVAAILHTGLAEGFSLSCLEQRDRVTEMAFSFPLAAMRLEVFNNVLQDFGIPCLDGDQERLEGLMVGFIDLVYRHQGQYFVADYKSNHLGNSPDNYGPDKLQAAMLEHRYDLQYLIYTVALHRYLGARLPGYSCEQHLGGIHYLFLRGMHPEHPPGTGIFSARPAAELVRALDRCFAGERP